MTTSDTQIEVVRQQLLADLTRVARQVESRLRFQAVLRWLMVTTAVIAGLLMVDCLFQRDEVGLRWLSWLVLLSSSTYAAYLWLWPILHLQVRPLDVAQWIEKRQPEWTGRISTALELAEVEPNDDRFGSQSFRDAVLAQWQAQPAKPRWDQLISNEKIKKAAAVLGLIASSAILLVAIWPELGVHALKRLFVPWSNERWPRADQLELVNLPGAVGRDSVIQLEVQDRRPPLPEEVSIEFRYPNEKESPVVSLPTQRVTDLAVASLPPIMQEVQVRAIGGDDQQMPWQTIRVVEVPGWKNYKFQIQPPKYIRESASALQRLTSSLSSLDGTYELIGQRIQIIAGSHVRFVGELASPIREISFHPLLVADSNSSANRNGGHQSAATLPWSVRLDADQVSVNTLALTQQAAQQPDSPEVKTEEDIPDGFALLNQSLAWAVRMETQEELILESSSHWKIEVLPDAAPEVVLESPHLKSLTLGAPLQVRAVARDDWGLRSVIAKLTLSSAPDAEYELPIDISAEDSREHSIKQEWLFTNQLASQGIKIKPQDQISLWLEARDLGGKVGKSNVERISLESKQRQLESLADRQSLLSEQLAELLTAQESAQDLAQRTAQAWQQKSPAQQHLDAIHSVNQLQHTIREQLVDSPRSLQAEIDRLLQLVTQNQLDDTRLAEQLKQLRKKVVDIGNEPATAALRDSNTLQAELAKTLVSGDKSTLSETAAELDLHQSQTATQLRGLVNQLDSSDSMNRLREELLEIAQQQEQLRVKTYQLNVESINKEPSDFGDRLSVSAADQEELMSRMEQWLSDVLQPRESPEFASVQQLVQQLQDAATVLVDGQVVGSMRSSSTNLKSQQLGLAVQMQKQIQQALDAALNKLGQADSSELMGNLASQEQRLRMLGERAEQLAQRQQQLANELSDPQASSNSQQLAVDQEKVEKATAQFADEIGSDERIRETITQIQKLQQQATQATTNKSMTKAAEFAAQAANKLDEVADQLDKRAELASQQVIQQQMFELAGALEQLVMDQQAIMPTYAHLSQQQAELTADFVAQSRSLVQKQTMVRESLRKLLPTTEQLQIFHWVLQQADSDLTRAIATAERNRLKPDAIAAADAGLRKLILANESLLSNPNNSESADNGNENQDNPPENDQQSTDEISLPPLASLKLIRSLQLELKEQTAALGSSNDSNRRTRILELTRQQQELGELLEKFVADAQAQQERGR